MGFRAQYRSEHAFGRKEALLQGPGQRPDEPQTLNQAAAYVPG